MNPINTIDINADLGEFQNEQELTKELNILKHISSCSVACGGHIGDKRSIELIVKACLENNIAIGAHPSYPDKEGFGRKVINITLPDLEKSLMEQIQGFLTVAKSLSMPVRHVKLHGKLYTDVSRDGVLASFFLNIIDAIDEDLAIIGPSNSLLESMAKKNGITFISEAFIDRRYRENYSLVDRNQDGAFLETIEDQMNQVKSILFEHKVLTNNNKLINIKAQTLCIHGDSPNAAQTARAVYRMLKEENIKIKPHSW